MHILLADIKIIQWIKDGAEAVKGVFNIFPAQLGNVLFALLVFLVLKFLAGIIKKILTKVLSKTNLDEKIAAKIGYKTDLSGMLITIIYLVALIFSAVIALDLADLNAASEPLRKMLDTMFEYLPKILAAGILLYILIFVIGIVKQLLSNVLETARIDERLGSTSGTPVASAIVSAVCGLLILLVVPAVLDVLGIEAISEPISAITEKVTAAIPKLLVAGAIIGIGVLIGQIVSRIVTNVLKGAGADQLASKFGLTLPTEGKTSLSSLVGTIVLTSIGVIVIASALKELDIEILSTVATAIVPGFFKVLLAAIVLFAGLIGSKFAFNALKDSNKCLAQIVRAVILIVVTVVALDRAGIASELTNLPYQIALYALGFAGAVGGAIALGLGAKDYVANWLSKRQ